MSWFHEIRRRYVVPVLATAMFAACSETRRRAITEPGVAERAYNIADLVATRETGVALSVAAGPGPGARASSVPGEGEGEVELISNGSFEHNGGLDSRVFAEWSTYDAPEFGPSAFRVQSGTVTPFPIRLRVPAPPDGMFSAMTSQAGPGLHIMSQVITLPANGNAQLSFRFYIRNRAQEFFSPETLSPWGEPNQQFRVDVLDPLAPVDAMGSAVLMTLFHTMPGDVRDTGIYHGFTADLSAFNGQTVRLRFAEVDNQYLFNVGIDAVSVIAQADPM